LDSFPPGVTPHVNQRVVLLQHGFMDRFLDFGLWIFVLLLPLLNSFFFILTFLFQSFFLFQKTIIIIQWGNVFSQHTRKVVGVYSCRCRVWCLDR
jgi:hypothetical protein